MCLQRQVVRTEGKRSEREKRVHHVSQPGQRKPCDVCGLHSKISVHREASARSGRDSPTAGTTSRGGRRRQTPLRRVTRRGHLGMERRGGEGALLGDRFFRVTHRHQARGWCRSTGEDGKVSLWTQSVTTADHPPNHPPCHPPVRGAAKLVETDSGGLRVMLLLKLFKYGRKTLDIMVLLFFKHTIKEKTYRCSYLLFLMFLLRPDGQESLELVHIKGSKQI